jgi:1A family penicillin-binding protein
MEDILPTSGHNTESDRQHPSEHPTRPQRPLSSAAPASQIGPLAPSDRRNRPTQPILPLLPVQGEPHTPEPSRTIARPMRRGQPDVPPAGRGEPPVGDRGNPPRLPYRVRPRGYHTVAPRHHLWQGFVFLLFSLGVLSLLVVLVMIAGYYYIAAQLPAPEELQERSFTFASTQIYDRNGSLMWELIHPNAGRRTWMPLSRIAPVLVAATIATEDRNFYANVGVDPIAVARAIYYDVTEGELVSGGSTITQQLARNVLLSPEERGQKSLLRKVREAVLAVEISRRYPKDKILEIYLNQVYYGNLAYGAEAASQTYYGKPAASLTLAEASLLAGLPQSPAGYDPIANPDAAKQRQRIVLGLMAEAGYITPAQAVDAYREYLEYSPPPVQFKAPHFITYVRQLVESRYGADLLYHEPGLRVQTTLDPRIQAIAEEEVVDQVEGLQDKDVTNGAVVVLNAKTGEILAMVGSKDFNDEKIAGQVNVALRPRQPGSAIKPLTYLAAFERGWTPATLLMDVPVEYPASAGSIYRPTNYDGKFRGPVLVRSALANSLNIPALKALEFVGVSALKEMARRLGITTLTRDDYGLALTLGGGEVTLLELTGAYQAMANGGLWLPPIAILKVTDGLGQLIEEYRPPEGNYVLRPEHAYLITHILADNQARSPAFGADSPLNLSRPAAVKTGTTNDFRDNWAVGYTPDIAVGVWVGNADNKPMHQIGGATGAAPVWHNIVERSLEDTPGRDFIRPPTIVEREICADSGTIPSPACPKRTTEIFAQDQPPLGPEHDIHQLLRIDTQANCVANEYAPANTAVERYFQVFPPDGQSWAIEQGIEQPPPACPPTLGRAEAAITWPSQGQTVEGVITIEGVALATNFSHYVVEYGVGWSPQAFGTVTGPVNGPVDGGTLAEWDTRQLPNGPYVLRVVVFDQTNASHEGQTAIVINNPVPTTPSSALEPVPDLPPPPSEPGEITIPSPEPDAPAPPAEMPTEIPLPAG